MSWAENYGVSRSIDLRTVLLSRILSIGKFTASAFAGVVHSSEIPPAGVRDVRS